METLLHDLRYGWKLLWKEKGFSVTALLTLAVCIGANSAIFGVIDTVLLDPLPYDDADRLVITFNSYPNAGAERASNGSVDYFYRRESVDAFEAIAVYQGWGHTVGEPGSTERLSTMRVSAGFFSLLRVPPMLGREFTDEEMEYGNEQKVILSYGFWEERFGADESAIGQDLRIDGLPYAIVGVLPEGFRLPGGTQRLFYVPTPFAESQRTVDNWHSNNYSLIARLRDGATIEQAHSQIDALNASLIERWPLPNAAQILEDAGFTVQIRNLKDDLLRESRAPLMMLWVGVFFVLLIGCVNIANLMLARSNSRMREFAARMALGADKRRLMRQVITESVFLSLLGGILGMGVGWAGIRVLLALGADDLPRGVDIGMSGDVLLFTLLLAVAAGVIFGAIPLVHIFRTELSNVFRQEGRTGTSGRGAVVLRNAMVTGQVAIAFVLLIGAGLLMVSFRSALQVEPGFQPEETLTGLVSMPSSRYPDATSRRQFADDLLREVRAVPGVRAAGVTSMLPFSGNNSSSVIMPEGYTPEAGESLLSPLRTISSPGYTEAMGIPLLEGRLFQEADNAEGQQVIIIDEWLARRYWPESSPLGRRMFTGVPGMDEAEMEENLFTIVGVVGVIKQNELTSTEHSGAYYFPYGASPPASVTLVAKAESRATSLTPQVREIIARIDPDMPFYGIETMAQRIDDSLVGRRTLMLLILIFSGVALFLSAVGIYGVLAYSVSQRTRELGIRMAVGSTPEDAFRLILVQGIRVMAVGLVIGLASALGLGRLIGTLLFGVSPADPLVLGSVASLLVLVGLAACVFPARKATRVDPVVALNQE